MTLDINDVTLEPLLEKGKLTYERMKKKTEGVFASLKLLLDQDTNATAPSQGKNVDLTDETFNLVNMVLKFIHYSVAHLERSLVYQILCS